MHDCVEVIAAGVAFRGCFTFSAADISNPDNNMEAGGVAFGSAPRQLVSVERDTSDCPHPMDSFFSDTDAGVAIVDFFEGAVTGRLAVVFYMLVSMVLQNTLIYFMHCRGKFTWPIFGTAFAITVSSMVFGVVFGWPYDGYCPYTYGWASTLVKRPLLYGVWLIVLSLMQFPKFRANWRHTAEHAVGTAHAQ